MADNVTLPLTGSGDATAVAATDDVGGVHYPIAKIASGTLGDTALIGGDATNGLDVDVTRLPSLPAGTNNIGDVDVLSVPAPLSTTGGGTEAAALRVTLANDSTGLVSVDDNGGSLTVDGSVTANAGTNLNTSALALESGGNLAGAAASLAVLDDWDESDRAKVNPIAGQAGVAGGSGVVGATTQRVVLATDVALPAGTNAIGKLAANSGVDIGDVDVASVVPGTGATNLGKAEDAAHTTGDVGVMMLGVRNEEGDNTLSGTVGDYTPIATDAMGAVMVVGNPNGNFVGVNIGTQAVDVAVVGNQPHDGADAGYPIKIGGKARTTNPSAVADGDRVDGTFDDIGRQVVVPFGVRDLVGHQHTQIASSSSETTIVTAGAAGVFHDLISLILTNQTATAVNVTIKDATTGTTRMIIALAASGGAVLTFPAPVNQASAAANWTATLSSAAVTVNIFAQFVKNV